MEKDLVPDIQDIKNFIEFSERNPNKLNFKDYFILKREDGKIGENRRSVYFDSPDILETHLTTYYSRINSENQPAALSS